MDTPNTSYFYLRKYNAKDRGFHRFGCIAIGKTADPGTLCVSYSLLAGGDKFNAAFARTAAVGRLNSVKHSINIAATELKEDLSPTMFLIAKLGITDKIARNHKNIALDKCEPALAGALLELEPRVTAKEETVRLIKHKA